MSRLRIYTDTAPETTLLDSRDDEGVTLKLADHDQLEGILACMRMAGVRVKELRTVKTDLEDVFVSMMQGQGS